MSAPMPPPAMTAETQRGYSSATFQRISSWAKTVRGRLGRGDAVQTENYQISKDGSFDAVVAYYAAAMQAMGLEPIDDARFAGGQGKGWSSDDHVLALVTVDGEDVDSQRPVYLLTTMTLPDR